MGEEAMRELTQENRCELNNIRNEIENMECLRDVEKLYAISDLLQSVLGLYDAESILGCARYRLEICRRLNAGRGL